MEDFQDKVAVITGAASGIGLAVAKRCVQEGMKVVLSDVERGALEQAERELKKGGSDVLAVQTDVSRAEDVENLGRKTLEMFGAVDLLFNNAGVAGGGALWENSLADWKWMINVNLFGVIHGIKVFVPFMLNQRTECHIVNTASIAGLNTGIAAGAYRTTKHAVVSLSETLYHDLRLRDAQIGVSVLCPGPVNTHVLDSERNRPEELRNPPVEQKPTPDELAFREWFRGRVRDGMNPELVAGHVFEAIRKNRFYIITHPEYKEAVRLRMEDILQDRTPTLPKREHQ